MRMYSVYTNPYLHLDPEGNPVCVVPLDPKHGGPKGRGRYVGASLDQERCGPVDQVPSRTIQARGTNGRRPPPVTGQEEYVRHRAAFRFEAGPVSIPVTDFYRRSIREGALIPADAATAQACGVAFEDPVRRVADTKTKAARDWAAIHGAAPEWATPPTIQPVERA